MSAYAFSSHQRWAVFQVHGDRCYMCTEPIDLKSMQIDHILPEALLQAPSDLQNALQAFGLPDGFDINSYENWLPACSTCNNKKRARVFDPAPIIAVELQRAKKNAPQCREIEQNSVRNADIAKSLTYLERAADRDELDFKLLEPLILSYAKAHPEALEALQRRATPQSDFSLGFLQIPEFRIAPRYKVLYTSGAIQIVQTPYGTGYVPTEEQPHHSFYCGHCGSKGPWNGARCLSCGMLDDGD